MVCHPVGPVGGKRVYNTLLAFTDEGGCVVAETSELL